MIMKGGDVKDLKLKTHMLILKLLINDEKHSVISPARSTTKFILRK